jgi:hypothetical protein
MCNVFICPSCLQNESSQSAGGVVVLPLPEGLEDAICFLLCASCASHIHPNDPTHPDRLRLAKHLTSWLSRPYNRDEFHRYSITTLKTLMFHCGDWRNALEIGWLHHIRSTDCNVGWIPGVLSTVEPKEPSDA